MMRRRRQTLDPMLTMINVVFLLITFFLFGRLDTPAPVAIDLPVATSAIDETFTQTITIDVNGLIYFGDLLGDDAVAGLEADQPTLIEADRSLPAAQLISILAQLRTSGILVEHIGVTL